MNENQNQNFTRSANLIPLVESDLVIPGYQFKPEVLAAMKNWRSQKPWRGNLQDQIAKLQVAHAELTAAYGLVIELDTTKMAPLQPSNGGLTEDGRIVLSGKFSVVTYLHALAYAVKVARAPRKAVEWSVNLYTRIFPRSAAHAKTDGYFVLQGV